MNYATTVNFFYTVVISFTLLTLNCRANITYIKNKSENPITVTLMSHNGDEFKNSPIEVFDSTEERYELVDIPLIIESGSSLKVNMEIPQSLDEFTEKTPFQEIPTIVPTYLKVTTKRFLRDKNRYQDATFNIVYGKHASSSAIWSQKIVATQVTAIAILGQISPCMNLVIDENGSPSIKIVLHRELP
ncbi:hypothetical protein JST56_03665 [Candidatus Dependentiae bacterium]|jgi:hypothetical protein|nr:hypothetical protein [Candidatus Dependentiae bacterium]